MLQIWKGIEIKIELKFIVICTENIMIKFNYPLSIPCIKIVQLLEECLCIIRRVILHNLRRIQTVNLVNVLLQFAAWSCIDFLNLLQSFCHDKWPGNMLSMKWRFFTFSHCCHWGEFWRIEQGHTQESLEVLPLKHYYYQNSPYRNKWFKCRQESTHLQNALQCLLRFLFQILSWARELVHR